MTSQSSITFTYINHRGEISVRTIHAPIDLELQYDPGYGYQPGWFVSGRDPSRNGERRSFALTRIIIEDKDKHGVGNRFFRLLRIEK